MSAVLDLVISTSGIRPLFDRLSAKVPALAHTSAEQRIDKIMRLIKVTLEHREEIYEAVRQERGLTPPDVDGELLMLKFEADFIAKNLNGWMRPQPAAPSLMTMGKKCYVQYEPKGIVLILPSWNAPYLIGLLPALGAIAAGNASIIKPSELAPHSSRLVAKIVTEAFPDGEVTAVQGGIEAAQALLACPFNHIFYIGNNTVGRIVMKAAADHLASVTLEMGGKNPSIIDASADIDDAAMKTAWGRLCNAGQACIAPDYVLVHESVAQRFIDALVREIKRQYDPRAEGFENNPEFPRIINSRHFQRIEGLIEDARVKGARFALGGETRAEDRYVSPTVVTLVNDEMKLMGEEIFGPVIAIVPFATRDEVIDTIRKRPKPLALYIFSTDRIEVDFYLKNTTAGSTVINHNLIQSGTNPYLPFGGVNSSGIGRMVGFNTFAECSNARSIIEEGAPTGDPRAMFPPLNAKFKQRLTTLLNKQGPVLPERVVKLFDRLLKLRGSLVKTARQRHRKAF